MKVQKKSRYFVSAAAALVIASGAAGGYAWQRTAKAEPPAQGMEVHKGNLVETASASGKIEPDVQVEVKSRVAGQVIEVLVKEGDKVEAGQLLVRLDPVDAQRHLLAAHKVKNFGELSGTAVSAEGRSSAMMAGLVEGIRWRTSAKGRRYMMATISDPSGQYEATVFDAEPSSELESAARMITDAMFKPATIAHDEEDGVVDDGSSRALPEST